MDQTSALDRFPLMPGWVDGARGPMPEDAGFASGAALATLHQTLARPGVPLALLRARLALSSAEACVRLIGRSEGAAELRDEVALLRPGDRPGPAGCIWQTWQQAIGRKTSRAQLAALVPAQFADRLPAWLAAATGAPVCRAATMLEAVLTDCPRDEALALMLADAVLARALGWDHPLPLLATDLSARDLRKTGEALRLACHVALRKSATDANRLAADLARRAARLTAVAPKLRAKTSGTAVALFLARDALAASDLTPPMSDRAARRLCDRLVALGAVRELTGRPTFRLYGV